MNCPLCHQVNTSFFAKASSYSFYACKDCDLIFMDKPKTAEKITKYYQNNFTYSLSRRDDLRLTNRAEKVIKNIHSIYPEGKSLLDIGAGQGHIMRAAQTKGYFVTGIEPSQHLYRQLKKEFGSAIINGDWTAYKRNLVTKYDVITLSHVIEHVLAPQEFIQELTLFLNPGGILYIETPNYDSYLARYEKQNYTFLSPPQHLWILSAKSLAKIAAFSLKKKKLKMIKIETYSYPEHFVGVIKSILKRKDSPYQSHKINASFTADVPKPGLIARIKILLFDIVIANLLYRLMNIHNNGSIIAVYLQKSA